MHTAPGVYSGMGLVACVSFAIMNTLGFLEYHLVITVVFWCIMAKFVTERRIVIAVLTLVL